MNKKHLIELVVRDTGFKLEDIRVVLDSILSNIVNIIIGKQLSLPKFVSQQNKLNLIGFGTFKKVIRKPRVYRHPQTGEKIEVGEKMGVIFKPGKKFKESLN